MQLNYPLAYSLKDPSKADIEIRVRHSTAVNPYSLITRRSLTKPHRTSLNMRTNTPLTPTNSQRHLYFGFFLTIALTIVSSPFTAASSPEKINYVYPDKVIFSETPGPDGKDGNPVLRLVSALFTEADIAWDSKQLPIPRMLHKLSNETGNFSILVKSPTIEQCCITSANPVINVELRAYHQNGRPKIKNIEDLAGKKIITIKGYSYGQLQSFFIDKKNNLSIYAASTHKSAFAMLAAGRADIVIDYEGPSINTLKMHPNSDLSYAVLKNLNLYLVINKKEPHAKMLIDQLATIAKNMDTDSILNFPKD